MVRIWKEAISSRYLHKRNFRTTTKLCGQEKGLKERQLAALSIVPLFGVQKYKSAAQCCTKCRQSARSRKSLTENSSICIIRSRILYVFTCLNVAGRLPMFLLIFVVFLLPPSHTHPHTTSYFNPLTPHPSYPPSSFKVLFYTKKEEICERFGMNTKKQGSVFMELSSSIDFYMPCTLVILTYVKAGKLHTPTHPPPPPIHPLHKDTPSLYEGYFTVL